MYLLIRYQVGVIVEGVVLAKGKNRMRVAAAGFADTLEFTRSGQQWLASTGQPVEFDFMMDTRQAVAQTSIGQASTMAASIPQ